MAEVQELRAGGLPVTPNRRGQGDPEAIQEAFGRREIQHISAIGRLASVCQFSGCHDSTSVFQLGVPAQAHQVSAIGS